MEYRPDIRGSDTEELIASRQAYAAAASDFRRQAEIVRDFEARHGITDVNDARHAAWYREETRLGRVTEREERFWRYFRDGEQTTDAQAEADLARALAFVEASNRFDAEHGGAR